jgi:hypothetical protein
MTTKSSDGQIDLFANETYVAPWLKGRSTVAFDPVLAERFRDQGICAAANAHEELLAQVKTALITIAGGRESRCATADDAARWLVANGYKPSELANASGSLFKGGQWELVGYSPSQRTSRHKNRVGIWKLKSGSGHSR